MNDLILDRVTILFSKTSGVPAKDIKPDMSFNDLKCDAEDSVYFFLSLEQEFSSEIKNFEVSAKQEDELYDGGKGTVAIVADLVKALIQSTSASAQMQKQSSRRYRATFPTHPHGRRETRHAGALVPWS